jgi:hypothetical protein
MQAREKNCAADQPPKQGYVPVMQVHKNNVQLIVPSPACLMTMHYQSPTAQTRLQVVHFRAVVQRSIACVTAISHSM